MYNILVVCGYSNYPLKASFRDHLFCFRNYLEGHKVFYYNASVSSIPSFILKLNFDLIIFHTSFLIQRWNQSLYKKVLKRVEILKKLKGLKVALPQDEFIYLDDLCNFIRDFEIEYVFSVAPASEWDKIYPNIDKEKVKFYEILTGYLENKTLEKIDELSKKNQLRPIDIGYRAWKAEAWLGRHGFIKTSISTLFKEKCIEYKLISDISNESKDTILGDKWYEFLLNCKYTISVEGGASILDRDGKIRKLSTEFVNKNPSASFDEIEANCFPKKDGTLRLFAISPRHLEACATKTCQILVEGNYNGVLKPNKHYIELKKDFSNIDIVMSQILDEKKRIEIVNNAYNDIVKSNKYTYRSFIEFFITTVSDKLEESNKNSKNSFYYNLLNYHEKTFIAYVFILSLLNRLIPLMFIRKILFAILSEKAINYIRYKRYN